VLGRRQERTRPARRGDRVPPEAVGIEAKGGIRRLQMPMELDQKPALLAKDQVVMVLEEKAGTIVVGAITDRGQRILGTLEILPGDQHIHIAELSLGGIAVRRESERRALEQDRDDSGPSQPVQDQIPLQVPHRRPAPEEQEGAAVIRGNVGGNFRKRPGTLQRHQHETLDFMTRGKIIESPLERFGGKIGPPPQDGQAGGVPPGERDGSGGGCRLLDQSHSQRIPGGLAGREYVPGGAGRN